MDSSPSLLRAVWILVVAQIVTVILLAAVHLELHRVRGDVAKIAVTIDKQIGAVPTERK